MILLSDEFADVFYVMRVGEHIYRLNPYNLVILLHYGKIAGL